MTPAPPPAVGSGALFSRCCACGRGPTLVVSRLVDDAGRTRTVVSWCEPCRRRFDRARLKPVELWPVGSAP